MPDLFAEMKNDLGGPENSRIREFFVLPHRRVSIGSKQRRFSYFAEEHPDLHGKIAILENHGYLIDVTPGNTPIYRMTEDFVELLLKT